MYDIIYIGGGLNYAGAIVAARAGKKVALIEKNMQQLGGVCLHKGCIPSKMFLHHAMTIYESKNSILEGELSLNMSELVNKKTALLEAAKNAVTLQCEKSGIELIEGEAILSAPYEIRVDNKTLNAKAIVIGSGSRPFIPEGIAYDGKHIITSDEVLELKKLPQSIAIYGSGAIGLEMAGFFAANGVKTTLIFRKEQILNDAHPLIQTALVKQLKHLDIKLMKQHPIKEAKSTRTGVTVTFDEGDTKHFSMLLVASGRKANHELIQTSDIACDKAIKTDIWFETTLKDHYAIGDCNGTVTLAHAARAQSLNVTAQLLGDKPKALNLSHVVRFMHTLPMSYARVGLSKSELEEKNLAFNEHIVTLNQFTYSAYNHAGQGVMISYSDKEGFILGAEILSPHAEEQIAPVAMALAGEMDVAQAKQTILAHPTFSEALERTFYKA